MKILITGGTGFIGSNLCKNLVKNKNNKIICLDNNLTGSIENIEELSKFNNFQFVEDDICNNLNLDIDLIFNLACPASPPKYQEHSIKTLETCFIGVKNILDLAKLNKAKLFHASTSEIYGDPKEHPQEEKYYGNTNCFGPRSCYDEGKRVAESLIYEYIDKYNLDARIGRIFNTYGPNMDKDDGRVVSNFINQAIKGHDLTVYGDGNQTRSFCYISDLIKSINLIMNTNNPINFPINIGNDKEFTILELANKIIKKVNTKSKIIHKSMPVNDPKIRKPDLTKAKKILNWRPEIELDQGLNETINYFRSKN